VPLSRRGRVWSYTENRYPPTPRRNPASDPFEPFAIAAVELVEEGLIILGKVVEGTLAADLKVGMEMELTTMPLYTDEDGFVRSVYAWRVADARSTGRIRKMSPDPLYILGAGMHPVGQVGAATSPSTASSPPAPRWAEAGLDWRQIQLVAGADTIRKRLPRLHRRVDVSRRSWAGNGVPVSSSYAACAQRARRRLQSAPRPHPWPGSATVALVIGADTTPKGAFRTRWRRAQETIPTGNASI